MTTTSTHVTEQTLRQSKTFTADFRNVMGYKGSHSFHMVLLTLCPIESFLKPDFKLKNVRFY